MGDKGGKKDKAKNGYLACCSQLNSALSPMLVEWKGVAF
jgi:hypothetical protein